MYVNDGRVITSPSDLTLASKCEYAFALQLDSKLGKHVELPAETKDPIQERAKLLGDVHEQRRLQGYRDRGEVIEFARAGHSIEALRDAAAATSEALDNRVPVVFQATFLDESDPDRPFIGFADFLELQPDGRYRVQDTKLARTAKVSALLQLAAYHEQVARLGIPVDDMVEVLLGTDETGRFAIDDIAPVYRVRRQRLAEIVRERMSDPAPVEWGDPRYGIDGRCDACEAQVVAHRDLLLVARIRVSQRAKLIDAGIHTIDELAAAPSRPEGCDIPSRSYASLHSQAVLQVSAPITDDPHAPPPFAVIDDAKQIAFLPAPDPGDLFFDFEGDPLYREEVDGSPMWNLDYLFGVVDRDENFSAYWAHSLAEEKAALAEFLEFVRERLQRHPGLHIYHYAAYERTHLLSLAARHRVGEAFVDDLLRAGVLVDLYPVVTKTVRVGGRSYSIKKLEPLYMGTELRAETGVTTAGDSVEQYNQYRLAVDAAEPETAARIIADIADYNRYDCVSTLRLHAWLIGLAAERGHHAGTTPDDDLELQPFVPDPVSDSLVAHAEAAHLAGDLDGAAAFRLASAAVDYHRREDKSFWWEHYARLSEPEDEWLDTRDVFAIEHADATAWQLARTASHRELMLRGSWAPGSRGDAREAFAVYPDPGVPYRDPRSPPTSRLAVPVRDVATDEHGTVTARETCSGAHDPWDALPIAIVPGPPPKTVSLRVAILEVANRLDSQGCSANAIDDILWRQPSRTRSGALTSAPTPADLVDAVTASALDLDRSFVAVQGPPGTGKTYLAARVIRKLVADHGWKVGVVAQSHKVVENVLRELVVEAGLDADLVGKVPGEGGDYRDEPFTALKKDQQAGFAAARAATGYVLGGTAWDFTNLKRVGRDQLDLLVIDEAGQFSLAATIAVSVAARNLLLLGDPQQLPQVSQGIHPAPVDGSALGYIADGHAVLPAEVGYFLPESWRMHSAVAEPVSRLSYEGALRSNPKADRRMLAGIAPGVHPVPVEHEGNATHSLEEAERVVALVTDHLGRDWTDDGTAPLTEADIIVVTPYNAQVETIRLALDAAGFAAVRVGTVDKFQGQQAAISIVSLAASSAEDVPRGLDFLLSRNRLNVAISRAKWAAYVLYSPALGQFLPTSPDGLAVLSRFLRLVE